MLDKIKVPTKIEIRKSEGRGMGVFCTEFISKGEIIEECLLLSIGGKCDATNIPLADYRFVYPKSIDWVEFVIPLGNGSIYNHSETPNADWINHENPYIKVFKFIAIKDISPEEEIFTYYGDKNYWEDGRTHTKLQP